MSPKKTSITNILIFSLIFSLISCSDSRIVFEFQHSIQDYIWSPDKKSFFLVYRTGKKVTSSEVLHAPPFSQLSINQYHILKVNIDSLPLIESLYTTIVPENITQKQVQNYFSEQIFLFKNQNIRDNKLFFLSNYRLYEIDIKTKEKKEVIYVGKINCFPCFISENKIMIERRISYSESSLAAIDMLPPYELKVINENELKKNEDDILSFEINHPEKPIFVYALTKPRANSPYTYGIAKIDFSNQKLSQIAEIKTEKITQIIGWISHTQLVYKDMGTYKFFDMDKNQSEIYSSSLLPTDFTNLKYADDYNQFSYLFSDINEGYQYLKIFDLKTKKTRTVISNKDLPKGDLVERREFF
ncbi:MAG: hypothetical protein IV090_21560 [Candidatus Sericytochromatia bacterium]|nr:hypothetical protein [Candidatus Sericytochromatia bacterium]